MTKLPIQHVLCAMLSVTLLVGCTDHQAQRQAQAQATKEQQAAALAKQYDSAVQTGRWAMARAHGAALLEGYAGTVAARRIEPGYAEVKTKAEIARELRRIQGLWQYAQIAVKGGIQRSAMIQSKQAVDVNGSGPKPVSLVFRDHPQWKRHSYLVLQAGDFDCYSGCQVQVIADAGKPRSMAAHRAQTDEAIAMFIDDQKTLWALLRAAHVVNIAFPVKTGGKRSAEFEVGGLDPKQMPGWP